LSRVRRTVYRRPVSDPAAPCTIRTLIEADLEATDLVLQAAYRGIESRVALIRRFLALDPESWRVAVDGTTIVGCVGAVDYGRFAYVGMMAVHPEAQSRIVRLDASLFGADRGRLLALMLGAYRGRAFGVFDDRGELSGFVIGRSGASARGWRVTPRAATRCSRPRSPCRFRARPSSSCLESTSARAQHSSGTALRRRAGRVTCDTVPSCDEIAPRSGASSTTPRGRARRRR
jgi:hypothetical protein